jgi:hypothetical protein
LKVAHADTTLPIDVEPEMTVGMLKKICLRKFGYGCVQESCLRVGRVNLVAEELLSAIGVQNKATLNFVAVPLLQVITIKSRLFDDLKLEVTGIFTIRDVKDLIVSDAKPTKDFLQACELQLAKGKTVFEDDDRNLTDYNIQNEAILTCSRWKSKANRQPTHKIDQSTLGASTAAASTAIGTDVD